MPALGVLFCLISAASVIGAAETFATRADRSAPSRIRLAPVSAPAPQVVTENDDAPSGADCARSRLFHDLD
jgi:hypothetical protein